MYKIYDYYEGKQLVAECEDFHSMQQAKKQYILDTDGECDLEVEFIDEDEKNSLEKLEKLMIENSDVLKRLKEC